MNNLQKPKYIFTGYHNDPFNLTEYDFQLYVTSAGRFFRRPPENIKTVRPDGRDDYHIIYIKDGSFIISGNNYEKELLPGDVAFIDYNSPHMYYSTSNQVLDYYWLHFKGTAAPLLIKDLRLYDGYIFHINNDSDNIKELFESILKELKEQTPLYMKNIQISLITLLTEMHRQIKNMSPQYPDSIAKLLSLMRSENCINMTLDDMAVFCNLSKSKFISTFKQSTGHTPIEYRNTFIIEKAKWHLRNTTMTITEISNILGFTSPSYFSILFKKLENCTPLQYRNKNYV